MRVGHKITELSTGCLYRVLAIRQTLLYFLFFVGCVTVDAQERPRVVRTSPENGVMSVDPATKDMMRDTIWIAMAQLGLGTF